MKSELPVSKPSDPPLARVLGRWDLTALGINQIIGASIFLIGTQIYSAAGPLSLLVIAAGGAVTILFALCVARLSADHDGTGGPYLFVRAAFGRFAGFEIGAMLWIVRVTSFASIANGMALALAYFVPSIAYGAPRALLIVTTVTALWAIGIRGVRQTSIVINMLTIAKVCPLIAFVVIALALSDGGPAPASVPMASGLIEALLLVIFSLGGVEVTTVPAGEARNPKYDVAFAALMAVAGATAILMLVQISLEQTLPELASSPTPVASASTLLIGPIGGTVATLTAVVSIVGGLAGGLLASSRIMFALASEGDLPPALAAVHERWQSPYVALTATAAVALGLALAGSFVALAAASAAARLVMYAAVAAAALKLACADKSTRRGRLVPTVALTTFTSLLFLLSSEQIKAGVIILTVLAAAYAVVRLWKRSPNT
jgi:amino acid transporter